MSSHTAGVVGATVVGASVAGTAEKQVNEAKKL